METALLVALGLVVGLAIAGLAVFIARRGRRGRPRSARIAEQPPRSWPTSASSSSAPACKQMGELLAKAQTQLAELRQRAARRGDARISARRCRPSTKHTTENLQKLNERLAVIDNAQKNITDLTSQVTSLRDVLSNKQARGAFGQGRMEAIIQDGLPKGAYEFQYTLSNGKRPDCVVLLPDQRPLVIDAKFPLEAVTAFREARPTTSASSPRSACART